MENKNKLEDLALLGGSSAFNDKLYVGRPNIGDREQLIKRINNILDSRWLTNDGPYVRELEQKIAGFVKVKHCVAVCNATIGLEIATRSLEMSSEAILPSMTFIATAHALQWQKITPVFCDINPKTWNIDPEKIEKLITSRTTGIIGVHLFGRPCNMKALAKIAYKYNLKLLYDAAHAFGCSSDGKMIGNFGDAEVFSFHATKFFNSLEGGAIVTNNDDLADKMRLMRNFGFSGYDKVDSIGTNGKMNEFSAAMGLTSFDNLSNVIKINYQNYCKYEKELKNLRGIKLINYRKNEKNNFQYIVLDINDKITNINRDQLNEILWAENVMSRRYFYPGCHKMEPYCSNSKYSSCRLPETEKIANRLLSLPTGTNMDKSKIKKLCNLIKFCINHSLEIKLRYASIKNNLKF